jgi:recombination protein RecA
MAKKSQPEVRRAPLSKAELVAKRINAEYFDKSNPEREVIFVGSHMRFQRVPRLPTGSFALDFELGGGWPRGRLQHIFGKPSTGKSLLAYKAIAEAQKYCQWCTTLVKQGGCDCNANDPIAAAWIDPEHTDSMEWRKKLNIDPDLFLYVPIEYGEEGIDYVSSLVRQPEIGIIVIDSIAAMAPKEVIEKSASDGQSPGALARIVTRGTRAWQAGLNTKHVHPKTKEQWDNLCTIFALNQLRDVINSSYPMPPQPPGGHALRHMASTEVKLSFVNSDFAMDGDKDKWEAAASAVWINFFTEKNKVYSPRRMGSLLFNFNEALIDNDSAVFEYAKRWGVVEKSGGWYSFHGIKAQGEDNFLAAIYSGEQFHTLQAAVSKRAADEIGSLVIQPKNTPSKEIQAAEV